MAAIHSASGAIGPNFAIAQTRPDFAVGTMVDGNNGRVYIYARAAGAIAQAGTCTVDGTTFIATSGAGPFDCQVVGGVVANDYFWARKTAI
jgi:hypothetical protein